MRKNPIQARAYERKADDRIAITPIEYGGLQAAFEHFSAALFDDALPDVFMTKFTCPACGQNAWGKPDLEIVCKPCGADMLVPAPAAEFAPEPVPPYEPTSLSYDEVSPAPMEPTKRKLGRPKGSKNKPKRGRPKGSKNRPKAQLAEPGTVPAKSEGEERGSSKVGLNH
jgi:hypothetical protein